jgi:hypothetical protein
MGAGNAIVAFFGSGKAGVPTGDKHVANTSLRRGVAATQAASEIGLKEGLNYL